MARVRANNVRWSDSLHREVCLHAIARTLDLPAGMGDL